MLYALVQINDLRSKVLSGCVRSVRELRYAPVDAIREANANQFADLFDNRRKHNDLPYGKLH